MIYMPYPMVVFADTNVDSVTENVSIVTREKFQFPKVYLVEALSN